MVQEGSGDKPCRICDQFKTWTAKKTQEIKEGKEVGYSTNGQKGQATSSSVYCVPARFFGAREIDVDVFAYDGGVLPRRTNSGAEGQHDEFHKFVFVGLPMRALCKPFTQGNTKKSA
ncbi:hypothetical protein AYI69_g7948 [Smittium culicis]|uniref:Uncharacterized protein n=1 Tax=Smittium culicis TaxID=133412 RepID=A0A1R1XNE4_9FUNG|nr:hypothetical protein AYI69_g7948 [Smittium culicis]